MGKGTVPDSRVGTVYTESLKRVTGCSYGDLVIWVMGRFQTAGCVQCYLHGISKRVNGCSYGELVVWVKGRQQVGYSVVYTESLKRIKGCLYNTGIFLNSSFVIPGQLERSFLRQALTKNKKN